MFKFLRFKHQIRKSIKTLKLQYLMQHTKVEIESNVHANKSNQISPLGWTLLIIPGSTFMLGTWQVYRKSWKEGLIKELKTRSSSEPLELPHNIENLNQLEYYPVHVQGTFLHDKEIYIGPRSLIVNGEAATTSSLISKGLNKSQGYLVITPFKLADQNKIILINRGWVSTKKKDSKTRLSGQVTGTVDVVGIIRLHENRPPFMPKNKPGEKCWFYRDLREMCAITEADPIFLDATNDFDVEGGPIGGQTRISLRNEHLSYILTWYSLCAFTSFMWYSRFIKGVHL